jgi:sulfite reductase (NADPH) flavoprotein alpha-component
MKDALQRLPVPVLGDETLHALGAAASGLSAEQLLWASGYLAGLAAAGQATAAPVRAAEPALQLTILYGSQTGNGRRIANELKAAVAARGVAAELVNMADFPSARLKRERYLAIVVSTHGEGDPPDDAMELHRFLTGRARRSLETLSYTVLALGDSSYENFCQTGREFDAQLEAAGAKRLAPLVECDLDYEAPAAAWSAQLAERAAELLGSQGSAALPLLRVVPPAPRFSKASPFEAAVLVNQRITGRGDVAVTGDEDHRHGDSAFGEPFLQLQTVDSFELKIDQDAAAPIGLDGIEKTFRRFVGQATDAAHAQPQ